MILIVNEKKLSKKYCILKKQQIFLFNQYKKLIKYLIDVENYLFNKLILSLNKNEYLAIFIKNILQKISNKMIPLNEYQNIQIEHESLHETKNYLLDIIDKFQSDSIKYFKSKRENIELQHELFQFEQEKENAEEQENKNEKNEENENLKDEEEENIYNAESVINDNDNNKILKKSINITQKQYEMTQKKYLNSIQHINEMEEHSTVLHEQINELISICMDQANTIST